MLSGKIFLPIAKHIGEFAKFYHQTKVATERLRSVKYRLITTIEEYQKTNKLQLAFTDKPGDLLPPMSVEEIKYSLDLLNGMHPLDVNTVNDLYHLSHDETVEIKVFQDVLIATNKNGETQKYNVFEQHNFNKLPVKVAYMVGYINAEKFMHSAYQEEIRYQIMSDNISSLKIKDLKSGEISLRNPVDILFSEDYQKFSKEDIKKISYICGQLSITEP
jgi:hypothetical protein